MRPALRGSRCQCTVCEEVFGNERGFDRHRIGDLGSRTCLRPDQMRYAGWALTDQGVWLTPDPRRAGAGHQDASNHQGATGVAGPPQAPLDSGRLHV